MDLIRMYTNRSSHRKNCLCCETTNFFGWRGVAKKCVIAFFCGNRLCRPIAYIERYIEECMMHGFDESLCHSIRYRVNHACMQTAVYVRELGVCVI